MERTPSFVVQSFGSYVLLDRIAVGGMAEIFKAKQSGARGFEKIVVIKKILQHLGEDPEFVSMFEDEAKIAAQLNQANIVQIYELGEINDVLYIVMEYVEGKNLRDLHRALQAKSLHLSLEQSLYIMTEVLKGLDYAHRKTDSMGEALEIIHRDMSPQNIVLSYEGEVKILDFGIAKAASKVSKTEAGVLKGKFSYMSPEQASGRHIDQTTDIYACAVILHEMLTSERLFRAETDMETLERVRRAVVPAPSERNALIPKELDKIVLKALQRDSEKRYQTANEFLSDLLQFASSQQLSLSSQDMSSFLKTIFEDNIRSERERLKVALSQKPLDDQSQHKNIKTHIAFKNPDIDLQASAPDRDATQVSVKTKRPGSFLFRFAIASFFIFSLIAFLWTNEFSDFTPADEHTEIETPPAELSPIETPKATEEPLMEHNEIIEPEEVTDSDKISIENVLEGIEVPKLEKSEKPPPKPAPSKLGLIDVVAPFEGFAQLYINDESYGSVPGPRARGIRLGVGKYKIRCETPSRIYEGEIEIQANSRRSIRCQELKEKTR